MRQKKGRRFAILRDGIVLIAIFVLGILIAAKLDSDNMQRHAGTYYVIDGDTLALNGKRFRLLGIDAPELDQQCQRNGSDWPCGQAAKQALAGLVSAGLECRGNEMDRYQRLLVRCFMHGQDVAAQMVRQGMAVRTEYFLFSDEEKQAKAGGLGLWAGAFEAPANWRKMHKTADMDVPLSGFLAAVRHLVGWE
jgi:endonuclease YncB( thermonuclease family)